MTRRQIFITMWVLNWLLVCAITLWVSYQIVYSGWNSWLGVAGLAFLVKWWANVHDAMWAKIGEGEDGQAGCASNEDSY